MNRTEVGQEALKATPPLAYLAALFQGVSIHDVVGYLTAAYLVMQMVFMVLRYIREKK